MKAVVKAGALAMNARRDLRRWAALGVIAFVANAGLCPALAQTAPPGTAAPALAAAPPSPAPATQLAPPPQLTKVHRRRPGLIATGAVIFGLSYGGALFLSGAMLASGCCRVDMAVDFTIPILGPVAGGPQADSGIMLLWSGAQLLGVVIFYYGMKGEDVPAARDVPTARAARPGPTFHLAPMLARDAGGMSLTARW